MTTQNRRKLIPFGSKYGPVVTIAVVCTITSYEWVKIYKYKHTCQRTRDAIFSEIKQYMIGNGGIKTEAP